VQKEKSVKISINDQEIELITCGHCGAVPTEGDAQKALNVERERTSHVCAICQQKIKLTEMKLTHHYYGGEHRWMIDGVYHEMIDISAYSGANWIRSTLHVSCLCRVAPGTVVTTH